MFRSVVPRLCRQAERARVKVVPGSTVRWFSKRGYDCSGRWLPIRRRPWFDDFGDFSWPAKMVDDQFRSMQKFMDMMSRMGPRMFEPSEFFGGWRAGGKQVEVKYNEKVFEVKLDVSEYSPEELNVKVAEDRLTISAKHSEKRDEHGYVSREFTRQFLIPEDVEADSIESILTNDGHLLIKGKVKGSENIKERVINIAREEPAAEEAKPEGDPKPEK